MCDMKKIHWILFVVVFVNSSNAQELLTRDSMSLGSRSAFIEGCVEGAEEEIINMKGLQINAKRYCNCVADELIPRIHSFELMAALQENDFESLLMKDDNMSIILNCLKGNYQIDDDFTYVENRHSEISRKFAVSYCIKTIKDSLEMTGMFTDEGIKSYCECAVDKLYEVEGMTYKDLKNIEDESSMAFNEIALPCYNALFFGAELELDSEMEDMDTIAVIKDTTRIPLVDYGSGYKIKINIDGEIRYFLFDTGASDLIINNDLERELLLNGTLTRDDYINETAEYEMANNEIVNARVVMLDHVTIGDFYVDRVEAAIIDKGSLLCGKSFLDNFKRWEIDTDKKELILYR